MLVNEQLETELQQLHAAVVYDLLIERRSNRSLHLGPLIAALKPLLARRAGCRACRIVDALPVSDQAQGRVVAIWSRR